MSKGNISTNFVQWKYNILYVSTVIYLIWSMVYNILGKFDPYIIWIPGCISLEWKTLNRLKGYEEGLIWALARFIKHKLGWFWTWWIVRYHFTFILSCWYIVLCCEKHSPRYRIMDKAGHAREINYQGHVRPRKWSELDYGWLIANKRLINF